MTDYRDWQMALGRRFRALKIWFVLRVYGIEGLKAHIRGHIRIGELFHSLVASRPDLFNVLTTPAFALTVFNVVPRAPSAGSAMINGNLHVSGDCDHDSSTTPRKVNSFDSSYIKVNGDCEHSPPSISNVLTNGSSNTLANGSSSNIKVNANCKHDPSSPPNQMDNGNANNIVLNGNSRHQNCDMIIVESEAATIEKVLTKPAHLSRDISPSSNTVANGSPKHQERENGVATPAESSSATSASLPTREFTRSPPVPSNSKPPLSSPPNASKGAISTDLTTTNTLTKQVYELINRRGEIYLTSTLLDDVYAIRVVSANPKADEMHVRRAFEILVEVAEEVRSMGVETLESRA